MRVILLLDNAPDYRESFLRCLGNKCELTVIAHPCQLSKLQPPNQRCNYNYIELNCTNRTVFSEKDEFQTAVDSISPQILCVSLNLRFPKRIIDFYRNKKSVPWIWWGQVFGKNKFLNPLKLYLIKKSNGALVYTEDIVNKINHKNVISFNNSQFSKDDFIELPNLVTNKLKLIFVGRPQDRKRLDLAIDLARRRKDVQIKFIGPGMSNYFKDVKLPDNLKLYHAAHGEDLKEHFKWSNLVINPGHAGLLVMNAATHNRAIIINSSADHAPEVQLAKEADQFFVDFKDSIALDSLIDHLIMKPEVYLKKADIIQTIAKNKYTVEFMADKHLHLFQKTLNKRYSNK
jgi:glycosyltransferase involved in cell wall biosynthesis